MYPAALQADAPVARAVQQRIAQHPADIRHDLWRAGGVQPVAAEIHAQTGHLEAAGVAAGGGFALDRGYVEAAAARKAAGSAKPRGAGSDYDKGRFLHAL
jgi:hypothetical protein